MKYKNFTQEKQESLNRVQNATGGYNPYRDMKSGQFADAPFSSEMIGTGGNRQNIDEAKGELSSSTSPYDSEREERLTEIATNERSRIERQYKDSTDKYFANEGVNESGTKEALSSIKEVVDDANDRIEDARGIVDQYEGKFSPQTVENLVENFSYYKHLGSDVEEDFSDAGANTALLIDSVDNLEIAIFDKRDS